MKTAAKRGLYIGTGTGLVLFCVAGLLPGSFLGGVAGLKITGALLGTPVGATMLSRVLVGVSMLLGVGMAAVICTMGSAVGGWLLGRAVDAIRFRVVVRREAAERA